MSDAGEGSLLQKGPLPHAPSSLPPKTFDLIESLLPVFQDYLSIQTYYYL